MSFVHLDGASPLFWSFNFKGEAVAGHIDFERARVLLYEALGQCTVSEVVLDATNQLRFVFARAVDF